MDGQVYDRKFPKVFEALSKIIHKDFVLDGELVALEPNGRPNFNELQSHQHTSLPIFYIAFDILHFGKRDLLDQPLEERKKRLAEIAEAFVKPIQPILVFPEDLDVDPQSKLSKKPESRDSLPNAEVQFTCRAKKSIFGRSSASTRRTNSSLAAISPDRRASANCLLENSDLMTNSISSSD